MAQIQKKPSRSNCTCGPTVIKGGSRVKISTGYVGEVTLLMDNVLQDGSFIDHELTIRFEAQGQMRSVVQRCELVEITEM